MTPISMKSAETGSITLPADETPAQSYLRLARLALDAPRSALLEERAIGRYSSEALRTAELALDMHEARLSPPSML